MFLIRKKLAKPISIDVLNLFQYYKVFNANNNDFKINNGDMYLIPHIDDLEFEDKDFIIFGGNTKDDYDRCKYLETERYLFIVKYDESIKDVDLEFNKFKTYIKYVNEEIDRIYLQKDIYLELRHNKLLPENGLMFSIARDGSIYTEEEKGYIKDNGFLWFSNDMKLENNIGYDIDEANDDVDYDYDPIDMDKISDVKIKDIVSDYLDGKIIDISRIKLLSIGLLSELNNLVPEMVAQLLIYGFASDDTDGYDDIDECYVCEEEYNNDDMTKYTIDSMTRFICKQCNDKLIHLETTRDAFSIGKYNQNN